MVISNKVLGIFNFSEHVFFVIKSRQWQQSSNRREQVNSQLFHSLWCRVFAIIPSKTVTARCPASPHITWTLHRCYKLYSQWLNWCITSRRCAGLRILLGWDKSGKGRFSSSASANVHFFDCLQLSFKQSNRITLWAFNAAQLLQWFLHNV